MIGVRVSEPLAILLHYDTLVLLTRLCFNLSDVGKIGDIGSV